MRGCRPIVAVLALTAATSAHAGIVVDPERAAGAAACDHLASLFAIDHKLQPQLKKGTVRIRCGPLKRRGKVVERIVRIMRQPAHELEVRLDRVTGRLWGLDVPLLPIPHLYPPKGGWPGYRAIEKAARAQGELDAEARLIEIERVEDEQTGLHAGQHPYATLHFEHVVEGATVLGDRVHARIDLRSMGLVKLMARPWNMVRPPKKRITLGRARRLAHRALRSLVPMDVPCCHPEKDDTELAIGDALSGAESVDEAERKKLKKLMRRARVRCPTLKEKRIFVPNVSGHHIEAWQFRCVPSCTLAGKTKKCKPNEAVFTYVTTTRGKVLGMKGQVAPQARNWKPGLPPSPAPMRNPVLERRAERVVQMAAKGVDKGVELSPATCPAADLGARIYRRCWKAVMTAEIYVGRVEGTKVAFHLPRKAHR
jgi:hypothetical protein